MGASQGFAGRCRDCCVHSSKNLFSFLLVKDEAFAALLQNKH